MSSGRPNPEWRVEPGLLPYRQALAGMEARVAAIAAGTAPERIWLVEHPPVVTAGTSADLSDLRQPDRFPVVSAGRGGQLTYHGPGQRVVYTLLDLGMRGRDVRRLVRGLEGWAIAALGQLGIEAFTSPAGTGIWVLQDGQEAKIGAIGIRVRRWVSFHGLAINVSTDLEHFRAIVPCGIADRGVAKVCDVRPDATMASLDAALLETLPAFLASLSPHRTPGYDRA